MTWNRATTDGDLQKLYLYIKRVIKQVKYGKYSGRSDVLKLGYARKYYRLNDCLKQASFSRVYENYFKNNFTYVVSLDLYH